MNNSPGVGVDTAKVARAEACVNESAILSGRATPHVGDDGE